MSFSAAHQEKSQTQLDAGSSFVGFFHRCGRYPRLIGEALLRQRRLHCILQWSEEEAVVALAVRHSRRPVSSPGVLRQSRQSGRRGNRVERPNQLGLAEHNNPKEKGEERPVKLKSFAES